MGMNSLWLLEIDAPTCLSLTLKILDSVYTYHKVSSAVYHHSTDLWNEVFSEEVYEKSKKNQDVFELGASNTNDQNDYLYVTINISFLAFMKLIEKYQSINNHNDEHLEEIATVMNSKPNLYTFLICRYLSSIAATLESQIYSDIITNGNFLRKYVQMDNRQNTEVLEGSQNAELPVITAHRRK